LSRRARGLPFWFSLATHGTDAYTRALESTLDVTRAAADEIAATPHTELIMEPELSVVLFRRRGWTSDQYEAWSARELAEGRSFVTSTSWGGETVLRICIVNPVTTLDDIRVVIDSLAD
jgi:L-2,4-diaminobutyrate decarboxylase